MEKTVFKRVLVLMLDRVADRDQEFVDADTLQLPQEGKVPLAYGFGLGISDLLGVATLYREGDELRADIGVYRALHELNAPDLDLLVAHPAIGGVCDRPSEESKGGYRQLRNFRISQLSLEMKPNSDMRIGTLGQQGFFDPDRGMDVQQTEHHKVLTIEAGVRSQGSNAEVPFAVADEKTPQLPDIDTDDKFVEAVETGKVPPPTNQVKSAIHRLRQQDETPSNSIEGHGNGDLGGVLSYQQVAESYAFMRQMQVEAALRKAADNRRLDQRPRSLVSRIFGLFATIAELGEALTK